MANIIKQKRGTTDPGASDLVVGELAINTTDGGVFTKTDGGAVVELARTSVSDDEKLTLGDNGDLEIFHNSANNNSVIKETGAGSLVLSGDNVVIKNTAGTENKAQFNTDTSVKLYYDNVEKIRTASTGIEVTGTCAATGFSGSGTSLTGVVKSDTTGITGASTVSNIVTISQANYDAISSPDANTIYYVTS